MSARILLVMLLAAPALVSAQGGGGGGSGAPPMNPDPTPFDQYVEKLTLRTEQLAPIQKIFTAASVEAAPVSRELLALRETMLTAESAGNADQFAAAAASYTTAAAKMAAVEIKAFAQAESVLMPKQLSKIAEAFVVIAGVFNLPTPRLNLSTTPGRRGGGGSSGGVLLSVAPFVAQRGGGGGGGGFGGPPPPTTRLGMMAMALTFSDEQKKQVKNSLDADYKNAMPLRDALVKSRLTLGTAIQTKKAPAEIEAATKAYADQASAMAQAEMKALAKVMKVLTDEQRANQTVMRWALNMSRGMLADKKWDTSPDHRFY